MKELALIQAKMSVPKDKKNGFGKYNYRKAEDIFRVAKPLAEEQKCHINVSEHVVLIGERYYMHADASITNTENETITVSAEMREADAKKGMDPSQLSGSTWSYAAKYALGGLLAVDDTEDADSMDNRQNTVHQQNNHPQNKQTQQTEFSKFTKTVVQLTGGNAENVTELYQEISQMFQVKIAKTDDFKKQAPEFQKQINQYISQKLGA